MKSVMNSNRSPFHAYKNGHDDGLRSSSWTTSVGEAAVVAGVSDCRMPDGQRTRTASTAGRAPSPKSKSDPETAGVAADVSIRVARLPARTCTFDPTADRLLTRPFSATRTNRLRAFPLL